MLGNDMLGCRDPDIYARRVGLGQGLGMVQKLFKINFYHCLIARLAGVGFWGHWKSVTAEIVIEAL